MMNQGQNHIDSLKQLVKKNKKENNIKVDHYNLLAKSYLNAYPDSIFYFAEKSEKLAKKINYIDGLAESFRHQGTYFYFQGDLEKSKAYLDSSLTYFKKAENLRGELSVYNNKGLIYKNSGQIKLAIENYNLALNGNRKLKDTIGILNNLINLANGYSTIANYEKSKDLFEEALSLALKTENQQEIASIYNGLGILEERKGEFDHAIELHLKAIEFYYKSNFKSNIAITYNNLANIETKQGNYISSINYFKKALEIAEEIGRKRLQGIFLNNIGNNYLQLGDYEKALNYYSSSMQITEKVDLLSYNASLANVALIKQETNQLDEAENLFLKNIDFYTQEGVTSELVNAYNNIGALYIEKQQLELAEKYLAKALNLAEPKDEYQYYLTGTYTLLAKIAFNKNELNTTIEQATKALDLSKKLGNKQRKAEVTDLLYQSFKKLNDYKQALFYAEMNKQISDDLFNSEKSKELGKIEAEQEFKATSERIQLENEKEILLRDAKIKQRTLLLSLALTILIALLFASLLLHRFKKREQKNNIQLQQANDNIEKQNKELKELHLQKNKLFSIVAHDLRGPLNNLNSMFELAAIGSIEDQEIQQLIPEINKELEKTILLTNNLLEWASQEMKEHKNEKTSIQVALLVDKIKSLFEVSIANKKIKFNNLIPADKTINFYSQTLNLVLRNLISNAIKYCNKNDEISVELNADKTKNEWIFSVTDTGMGMEEKLKKSLFSERIFSKKGTNNESGTGLGLVLSQDFIERANGKIWIQFSAPQQGTKICFSLPM